MQLKEERMQWRHDGANIEKHVDAIIEDYKEADANPVAYMALDMVYRPYFQWIHSAQVQDESPNLVRDSLVHLMNMMILEWAARSCHPEDGINNACVKLDTMLYEIRRETRLDFETLFQAKCPAPRARGRLGPPQP